MRLLRIGGVAVAVAALAGVALLADSTATVGTAMTDAAEKFLATLSPDERARATFAFDDPERLRWNFIPLQDREKHPTRKGLRLEEMSEAQKAAALNLVRVGLSPTGYTQATTIMSLENILHELEKNGANVRNPGWYFVSVFGTPSKTGPWGWRIEGHHLSLNFALDKGRVSSVTPSFFGANPAEVKAGPRKGLRTLPECEDLARELIRSLTKEQDATAKQAKQLPEVDNTAQTKEGQPVGLPGAQMNAPQRELLLKLLKAYTDRLPAEVSAVEYTRVTDAGAEKIHFAYAGGPTPGEKYTYRVTGPTFVVQFLNSQADSAGNPANHIHSVWRHLPGDFGKGE
jgi:hypothetical protein